MEIHPLVKNLAQVLTVLAANLALLISTAKLSPILLPRTLSFAAGTKSSPQNRPADDNMPDGKGGRRRRSSSLIYTEPAESTEHMSDQSALPNLNADWVNAKGKRHPILLLC